VDFPFLLTIPTAAIYPNDQSSLLSPFQNLDQVYLTTMARSWTAVCFSPSGTAPSFSFATPLYHPRWIDVIVGPPRHGCFHHPERCPSDSPETLLISPSNVHMHFVI